MFDVALTVIVVGIVGLVRLAWVARPRRRPPVAHVESKRTRS